MTDKKPSKKDAELARLRKAFLQYQASDLHAYASAHHELQKLGKDRYLASGVIVTIQNLSGETKVGPVMISDGLSAESIAALMADVRASYDSRIAHPVNRVPSGEFVVRKTPPDK